MLEYSLPTLYKNKQRWDCSVKNLGKYSEIYVYFGQDGGKIQTKTTRVEVGKNIGKSNETTHYEQACAEAESKWRKQKDKLYTETNTISDVTLPMLAHSFYKHSHKLLFPLYLQPKLDGIRCIFDGYRFTSRKGKEFKSLEHLFEESSELIDLVHGNFDASEGICLDGELYSEVLSFQEIVSAVKRDEPNELTKKIKYYIYDVTAEKSRYQIRHDNLKSAFDHTFQLKYLDFVPTFKVNTLDEVCKYHELFTNVYEGVMLRNGDGLYQKDTHSYGLQKVKKFDDKEFKIVGCKIDKNSHPVFTCITDDGHQFDVKPEGTHAERLWYLEQDHTGHMLTVKYFGFTTGDKPVPRFPVGLGIRDYE